METPNQAVVKATKSGTLKDMLQGDDFARAVKQVLPKHLTAERFIRVAILALTRTPKLAQCDKASFFGSLMTLSQLGLEPDGRRAHLIPFENRKRNCVECQLIVDWKGLAELAMRSGIVANLHADVVADGDLFDYSAGRVRSHVPWFLRRDSDRPSSRGSVFAVYAVAEFKDGSSKAEVMSIDEVNAIRRRSRAANAGPWMTDYNEMAKKTVFRRLSKWLPLSPEFRDAIEKDDEASGVIDVETSKPTFDPPAFGSFEEPEPEQVEGVTVTDTPEVTEVNGGPVLSPAHKEIEAFLATNGVNFDDFRDWLIGSGRNKNADSWDSVVAIPTEAAAAIANDKDGLSKCATIYGPSRRKGGAK